MDFLQFQFKIQQQLYFQIFLHIAFLKGTEGRFYFYFSIVEIISSFFISNRSIYHRGGSIFSQSSNLTLIGVSFNSDNSSSGGSIFSQDSNFFISESIFIESKSLQFGGLIFFFIFYLIYKKKDN